MKSLIVVAGLISCIFAATPASAQVYGGLGLEAAVDGEGLTAIAGIRGGPMAIEVEYRRGGFTLIDARYHSVGGALLGFYPLTVSGGIPVEIVGRLAQHFEDDNWRATAGVGLQFGHKKGAAFRVLVEAADGGNHRGTVHLLYSF